MKIKTSGKRERVGSGRLAIGKVATTEQGEGIDVGERLGCEEPDVVVLDAPGNKGRQDYLD
jgi:hypothetical protein